MLEPLRHLQTCVTPYEYSVLRRVAALERCSLYALVKRALLAYLVAWAEQHPDMVGDVLRPC